MYRGGPSQACSRAKLKGPGLYKKEGGLAGEGPCGPYLGLEAEDGD